MNGEKRGGKRVYGLFDERGTHHRDSSEEWGGGARRVRQVGLRHGATRRGGVWVAGIRGKKTTKQLVELKINTKTVHA